MLELEKAIVMLDFSTLNLSKCNISCKKTFLNVVNVYFGLKLQYIYIYIYIFYSKSPSSNLLTSKVSSKNEKTLNLGTKIAYLGIFWMQFDKNYSQRI